MLDVILTNCKNIVHSGVINYGISDHLPVFLVKKRQHIISEHEYIHKRSFKNYDIDTLAERLCELDWTILDLLVDVNLAWSMVYKGLLKLVNDMCPFKNFKVRKDRPIWYNSTLLNLERERDILTRNYRRDDVRKADKYKEMVSVRKKFNKALRESKQDFYKNQIEYYKNDAKNFWKMLDGILGKRSEKTIERVYYYGTNVLCDEFETVRIINEFFASIGGNINLISNEGEVTLGPVGDGEMSEFCPMTCNVFLEIIGELKSNKSSGLQDINSRLMLDIMNSLPEIFVKLINLSLSSGVFPDEWKIARICVIPKKGDIKNLDNLRPISLLSILGKIIEKFVKVQLVSFFEEQDLFFNYQFGFRTHLSINDAIFILVDNILRARNNHLASCVGY